MKTLSHCSLKFNNNGGSDCGGSGDGGSNGGSLVFPGMINSHKFKVKLSHKLNPFLQDSDT